MNPARSRERITVLPSVSEANSSMSVAVSADVSNEVTSSTSGNTGTGLKKWMPMTWDSRLVARASFMIGMLDVFDASTASGLHSASSRPNTSIFIASSSATASITRSQSPSASSSMTERQSLPRRIVVGFRQPTRGDGTLQRRRDAGHACFGRGRRALRDDDVESCACRHLGDARSHQAASDHTYFFDHLRHAS